MNSEAFLDRLERAAKQTSENTDAIYYDLTQDPGDGPQPIAESLRLGDHVSYLQIPHIGEYENSGYTVLISPCMLWFSTTTIIKTLFLKAIQQNFVRDKK